MGPTWLFADCLRQFVNVLFVRILPCKGKPTLGMSPFLSQGFMFQLLRFMNQMVVIRTAFSMVSPELSFMDSDEPTDFCDELIDLLY